VKLQPMGMTSLTSSARMALTCILCFVFLLRSAAPRQRATDKPGPSIKATSVEVNVYVIAEGRHGRLVRDLNKEDFELTDDAAPQKIQFFSRETDVTLSLGVAIDTSVSQEHLLAEEQAAAKQFLHSVLHGRDQALVMNFDVDVRLLQDFTNEPQELSRAIDAAEINYTGTSVLQEKPGGPIGGTHLYDAVFLASNELMKTRQGRKVLVFVTDGEDQGSKIDLKGSMVAAEKADMIVYSIVLSDPEYYTMMGGTYHGDASVRKLARETGGRTIRVKTVEQIGPAFEQIARELRSQYLLGYSPSDPPQDGSFRRLQVKVRGHNYTVRTRSGYYDQTETATQSNNLGAATQAP
jgi:VWFA-related protein